MGLYRKKPAVIEAMQNDGTFARADTVCHWAARNGWGERVRADRRPDGYSIAITTLEGTMEAPPTAWVIKGVKGEFYPCAADVFEATYDPVSSPHEDDEDARSRPDGDVLLASLDLQQAIATLEGQHHTGELWGDKAMTVPVCSECEERWPCPTIVVVRAARPALREGGETFTEAEVRTYAENLLESDPHAASGRSILAMVQFLTTSHRQAASGTARGDGGTSA